MQKKNIEHASTTCELVCLKQLLEEVQFGDVTQMTLIRDNQVVLHINSNFVFHEMTKHMEVDFHFTWEKIVSEDTKTAFVNLSDELVDTFTKPLRDLEFIIFVTSFTHNLYVQAWWEMLEMCKPNCIYLGLTHIFIINRLPSMLFQQKVINPIPNLFLFS